MLKDKNRYLVIKFPHRIDKAMGKPVKPGHAVNVARHVGGSVKDFTDIKTRLSFERIIDKVSKGASTASLKRLLGKLVENQQQEWLQESLYFMDLIYMWARLNGKSNL